MAYNPNNDCLRTKDCELFIIPTNIYFESGISTGNDEVDRLGDADNGYMWITLSWFKSLKMCGDDGFCGCTLLEQEDGWIGPNTRNAEYPTYEETCPVNTWDTVGDFKLTFDFTSNSHMDSGLNANKQIHSNVLWLDRLEMDLSQTLGYPGTIINIDPDADINTTLAEDAMRASGQLAVMNPYIDCNGDDCPTGFSNIPVGMENMQPFAYLRVKWGDPLNLNPNNPTHYIGPDLAASPLYDEMWTDDDINQACTDCVVIDDNANCGTYCCSMLGSQWPNPDLLANCVTWGCNECITTAEDIGVAMQAGWEYPYHGIWEMGGDLSCKGDEGSNDPPCYNYCDDNAICVKRSFHEDWHIDTGMSCIGATEPRNSLYCGTMFPNAINESLDCLGDHVHELDCVNYNNCMSGNFECISNSWLRQEVVQNDSWVNTWSIPYPNGVHTTGVDFLTIDIVRSARCDEDDASEECGSEFYTADGMPIDNWTFLPMTVKINNWASLTTQCTGVSNPCYDYGHVDWPYNVRPYHISDLNFTDSFNIFGSALQDGGDSAGNFGFWGAGYHSSDPFSCRYNPNEQDFSAGSNAYSTFTFSQDNDQDGLPCNPDLGNGCVGITACLAYNSCGSGIGILYPDSPCPYFWDGTTADCQQDCQPEGYVRWNNNFDPDDTCGDNDPIDCSGICNGDAYINGCGDCVIDNITGWNDEVQAHRCDNSICGSGWADVPTSAIDGQPPEYGPGSGNDPYNNVSTTCWCPGYDVWNDCIGQPCGKAAQYIEPDTNVECGACVTPEQLALMQDEYYCCPNETLGSAADCAGTCGGDACDTCWCDNICDSFATFDACGDCGGGVENGYECYNTDWVWKANAFNKSCTDICADQGKWSTETSGACDEVQHDWFGCSGSMYNFAWNCFKPSGQCSTNSGNSSAGECINSHSHIQYSQNTGWALPYTYGAVGTPGVQWTDASSCNLDGPCCGSHHNWEEDECCFGPGNYTSPGCVSGGMTDHFCEMGPLGLGPNGECYADTNCNMDGVDGPGQKATAGVVAIGEHMQGRVATYPHFFSPSFKNGTQQIGQNTNCNSDKTYIGIAHTLHENPGSIAALCCCVDYLPGSVIKNGVAWGCLEDEVEDCHSAGDGYNDTTTCEDGVCNAGARYGLSCNNEEECPGNCHSKAWLWEGICDTGEECGDWCNYYGPQNVTLGNKMGNDTTMTYYETQYHGGDVIFNVGDVIVPQPVDNRCCGSYLLGTPEYDACGC